MKIEKETNGDLAIWGGADTAVANFKGSMLGDAAEGGGFGFQYLSFSGKTGVWGLGKDRLPREDDWLAVVEPEAFTEGWTCWKNSRPVAKVSWLNSKAASESVSEGELEDHGPYDTRIGEGWRQLAGMAMLLFNNDDEPVQAKYETNAVSAVYQVAALLKACYVKDTTLQTCPVIEISEERFQSRGQWNYKPIFTIVGWVAREDVAEAKDNPTALYEAIYGEQAEAAPPPKKQSAKERAKAKAAGAGEEDRPF